MKAVLPYINFNGHTEEAFRFYQSVFGGELAIIRFREMGGGENPMGLSEADLDKIAHIALLVDGKSVLLGSDTLESLGHALTSGNNFNITIEADSVEETQRLFDGLSSGGEVTMALEEQEWAEAFATVNDKYGISWILNCVGNKEMV